LGFALVFILLTVLGLFLYIRQIERDPQKTSAILRNGSFAYRIRE